MTTTIHHTATGEPVKVGDVLAHLVKGKNPRLENYRVYEIPRCSGRHSSRSTPCSCAASDTVIFVCGLKNRFSRTEKRIVRHFFRISRLAKGTTADFLPSVISRTGWWPCSAAWRGDESSSRPVCVHLES